MKFFLKYLYLVFAVLFTNMYCQSTGNDFEEYFGVWSDGEKLDLDISKYNYVESGDLIIGYYRNKCSVVFAAKKSNNDIIELFYIGSKCDINKSYLTKNKGEKIGQINIINKQIILELDYDFDILKKGITYLSLVRFPPPSVDYSIARIKGYNKVRRNEIIIPFPLSVVDKAPIFPGCENINEKLETIDCFKEQIQKHIHKQFKYPNSAQKKGIQGTVSVSFVVKRDGSIDNVILDGGDIRLQKESERIIKMLPKITPGKYNGDYVDISFKIPIVFKLK